MTLSARNRLEGKIVELQLGGVMAHVVAKSWRQFDRKCHNLAQRRRNEP